MIPPALAGKVLERVRRWTTNQARRRFPELNPRRWSNAELRRLGPLFKGHVVNISGYRDEDKEGGMYRDYFPEAADYSITNYDGSGVVGDGAEGSIYLDLQAAPDPEMKFRFNVGLNHTVLEHIEFVRPAFAQMSHLVSDALITVVPFAQDEHYSPGIYGDYWRISPLGLKSLYEENGFTMIYLNANESPWYPVYLCAVGVRDPSAYADFLPSPWTSESRVARETYVYPDCAW